MDQRDTILIVDNRKVSRAMLRRLFEQEYNLLEAESGEQALLLIRQYRALLSVVLLDVFMPEKTGYEVLEVMGAEDILSHVPVVLITADATPEGQVRGFDLGATDLILKPFEPHVVFRRVQNIIELHRHKHHLEELVDEQARTLRQSNEIMLDALSSVIEHRSMESGQHVLRIRSFTRLLLEDVCASYPTSHLHEDEITLIARASALHDIGKIAVPDAILNKPGLLSPAEFEIMKVHAVKGCEILAGLERLGSPRFLQYAYDICRHHHERWNGEGYPDGLRGREIPLWAHVVGLADAYDALTTHRVYKGSIDHSQAVNMILGGACGSFSPMLLECFKNVEARFAILSREFADGRMPRRELATSQPAAAAQLPVPQAPSLGQMKYLRLLRYLDATVLEADLDTGIYHVVYLSDSDFDALRAHKRLDDALEAFIGQAVHPDDRQGARQLLGDYAAAARDQGQQRRVGRFRVLHGPTGQYRPHTATLLRMDEGQTYSGKIIFVWEVDRLAQAGRTAGNGDSAETSVLNRLLGVCRSRNDAQLSCLTINEGFTAITGFTDGDVEELFHGNYERMIYPADREAAHRRVTQQLRGGATAEAEYRLRTKDGRLIWLLDKMVLTLGDDGHEYLSSMVMDITTAKKAQESLRLNVERNQIIMDQTNDIIFEWDIEKDWLSLPANWEKRFGYTPIRQGICANISGASHLMPDDVPAFMEAARALTDGAPYQEVELRIANATGRYIWCRVRATAQFDDNGRAVKAVGVITDVDQEKRQVQDLLDKAERDSLTQIYNKQTARLQVEHFLQSRAPEVAAAMFIIDVDDFKLVNDTYGHLFGDAVLAKIAMVIRNQFRTEDLVARIGGDEFMVFVRHQSHQSLIEQQAQRMLDALRGVVSEDMPGSVISCSVGVSLCPQDGTDFQTLYQRCDKALYRAKAQGKNCFSLYQQAAMVPWPETGPMMTPRRTDIESDETGDALGHAFVHQAFQLLYEADDVAAAVQSILEMLGRRYNVSRAYIFEVLGEENVFDNTFEWCNTGILPEKHLMQRKPVDCLGEDYRNHFEENGIFYCPDVDALPPELRRPLQAQNIKSMLQCAMRSGGRFAGYVGFEDCTAKRLWTKGQIDVLTFLSNLLTTFLLKKRAQDQALSTARDLQGLLDNQNSWIYVIDPERLELLYINEKTRQLVSAAQLGMHCYAALLGQSQRCEQCPAQNIRQLGSQTRETYNQALDSWFNVDASLIRWRGRDAVLVSCRDITSLKRSARQPPE